MKVLCYSIQNSEKLIFQEINKKYQFQLEFTNERLNNENISQIKGFDALILFANCDANAENLKKIKELGIKYIVTRTAGFNHIDLKMANKLGYVIGRVPEYSPVAIASLAVSGGLSLLRKTAYIYHQTKSGNFKIDDNMFAKEITNTTIGIIGTGKIGMAVAKAFKGMQAKVLGYDIYPNDANKVVLDYVTLDELLAQSDLISLHSPYIPGENENMINKDTIAKMKKGAVLVNSSRSELVYLPAVINAIKKNHLSGAAIDVFPHESEIINCNFSDNFPNNLKLIKEFINLYPKALISPHVAYFTDEAIKNMAEISFKNLYQLKTLQTCDNKVN